MSLKDMFNKIVAIQEFDIAKETSLILDENSDKILNILKYGQLAKGKDKNGDLIMGGEYADWTIDNKEMFGHGIGRITDWVTLYMSGEFYNSLIFVSEGDEFWVDSRVPYFSDILDMAGGDKVIEFSKESLQLISDIVKPELVRRFNDRFNRT